MSISVDDCIDFGWYGALVSSKVKDLSVHFQKLPKTFMSLGGFDDVGISYVWGRLGLVGNTTLWNQVESTGGSAIGIMGSEVYKKLGESVGKQRVYGFMVSDWTNVLMGRKCPYNKSFTSCVVIESFRVSYRNGLIVFIATEFEYWAPNIDRWSRGFAERSEDVRGVESGIVDYLKRAEIVMIRSCYNDGCIKELHGKDWRWMLRFSPIPALAGLGIVVVEMLDFGWSATANVNQTQPPNVARPYAIMKVVGSLSSENHAINIAKRWLYGIPTQATRLLDYECRCPVAKKSVRSENLFKLANVLSACFDVVHVFKI
ncbi:hypothetical protein Tco_0340364 [Tanacetum coccineum]